MGYGTPELPVIMCKVIQEFAATFQGTSGAPRAPPPNHPFREEEGKTKKTPQGLLPLWFTIHEVDSMCFRRPRPHPSSFK